MMLFKDIDISKMSTVLMLYHSIAEPQKYCLEMTFENLEFFHLPETEQFSVALSNHILKTCKHRVHSLSRQQESTLN